MAGVKPDREQQFGGDAIFLAESSACNPDCPPGNGSPASRSGFDPRSLRIGIGYDVHALVEGRRLILGGVEIPHSKGLLGHSDADVLAHAVADALLGAAREGDIGSLFPDTDPRFAGADSLGLLSQVAALVRERGFSICDVDSVVAAQAPRLAHFRDQMRKNLAQALGIDLQSVGVKATTTEHLGFEGREEGIGVYATVLLYRCSEAPGGA